MERIKKVTETKQSDFIEFPVWEIVNDDHYEEIMVQPIMKYPVDSLAGRIIGTFINMSCGKRIFCTMQNINLENEFETKHVIGFSFMINRKWFHLARYHDPEADTMGLVRLCELLNHTEKEIFPISYDINDYVSENMPSSSLEIEYKPQPPLSRSDIIKYAVSGWPKK